MYRLDGTVADVEIAYVRKEMPNGPILQASLRDLTARNEGRRRVESLQNALVSGLIDAQEEERRTIAYDLHDGLTQYIAAANAHLEACLVAWESQNFERAAVQLGKMREYLQQAGMESRRLVNGLRCLTLDDLGLAGAVEQLLAEDKKKAGWESATLSHNLSSERFNQRIETAAFRVVQEALNNVLKHASAQRVQVSLFLLSEENILEIEIQDDGLGLEASQMAAQTAERTTEKKEISTHVGLHGMSERVRLLGGVFFADSPAEGGTIIRAQIPLSKEQKI